MLILVYVEMLSINFVLLLFEVLKVCGVVFGIVFVGLLMMGVG